MKYAFIHIMAGFLSARTFTATSLLFAAFSGYAESITPGSNDALLRAPPSRMRCSPVTPDTKVPFIETMQQPDFSRDPSYFEACSDLDYAWTPQSYPNPKYVPRRTSEHEARVNLLMQGIKDYVTAESDDWVSYVNAQFGSSLPPSDIERLKSPSGGASIYSNSYARDHALLRFETSSKIFGVYGIQRVSPEGAATPHNRRLSIIGLDSTKLCITPVDLQKAFENQPGYLLRPMSVRAAQARPSPQELAKLGGQWFGYQVHIFSGSATGQNSGLMLVGFSFKPCAARIEIDLTKTQKSGEKQ